MTHIDQKGPGLRRLKIECRNKITYNWIVDKDWFQIAHLPVSKAVICWQLWAETVLEYVEIVWWPEVPIFLFLYVRHKVFVERSMLPQELADTRLEG
mgnify:CR=1 FL=1